MKEAAFILTGAVLALLFARRLNSDSRYISLANVRRGIANEWYTALLAVKDGKYYVRLTGLEADGDYTSSYYEISERTFEALKDDGVGMENQEDA